MEELPPIVTWLMCTQDDFDRIVRVAIPAWRVKIIAFQYNRTGTFSIFVSLKWWSWFFGFGWYLDHARSRVICALKEYLPLGVRIGEVVVCYQKK